MPPPERKPPSPRFPVAVIGWNEYVELPEWGVRGLRAKIDTGARSSALHVENVEIEPRGRVSFDVVLHREKRDRRVRCEAPIARTGRVRSSTGHYEKRIFVETVLRIGPVERLVEISLVDREKMIYRMLIGRTALGGRFLIDVAHECLHGRPRKRRKAKRRSS